MEQVLLDSNFIITCVRQNVDFIDQIENLGLQMLVPEQVIKEIEKLSKSKSKSLKLRNQAELSLKIIKANPDMIKNIKLPSRNVDTGIKKFADRNLKVIIATLDRELKQRTNNQKLVIRNRKRLEII